MKEISELIPGLPEEIALECLTRLHYSTHRVAARVSRRWRELIKGKDFYSLRKRAGHTRKVACLDQALQIGSDPSEAKAAGAQRYGVSIFDPISGNWEWVDLIPQYPDGIPLFCQVTSSEGKLVLTGGWDPSSFNPVKDVFMYDFTARRWEQGKDMPDTRSFFGAGEFGGRVYVAGGHDEGKNALKSAWVYDVGKDVWDKLSEMAEERDECEGIAIGSELWVVSGYGSERQGRFATSGEAYRVDTGEWRRVENVWKEGLCPRCSVGIGRDDGKLFSWAERDSGVRVGTCAVTLDDGMVIVFGSIYQGETQGLYLVEEQNGKFKRMEVPIGFSRFVQSGCSVDI